MDIYLCMSPKIVPTDIISAELVFKDYVAF